MFTWRVLDRLGIRTSFEEFFNGQARPAALGVNAAWRAWLDDTGTCGEVSSLAAPHVGHLEGTKVIQIVRNPVAVIASLMGLKTFSKPLAWSPNVKFNFRHVPQMSRDDAPIMCCMKYWLRWNEMVEQHAVATFRSEALADLGTGELKRLISVIGGEFHAGDAQRALDHFGTTWNAKDRDHNVRWQRLPGGECKGAIATAAQRYGYTLADLREHCPHCGVLP